MKLSEYCKKKGVTYKTGFNWFHKGLIKGAYQIETGSIFVEEDEEKKREENVVIYCRVSSYQKRDDLNRQVERCKEFCAARGLIVNKVFKEVASGMNDNRKEFWKMLNSKPTTIVVENKDRLTRFGFKYIENLCGGEIIVINPEDNNEKDLFRDLISVITSFCCRLYGIRRGSNRAKRIKEQITDAE